MIHGYGQICYARSHVADLYLVHTLNFGSQHGKRERADEDRHEDIDDCADIACLKH